MDINVAVDKKMTLKPDTRDVADLTAPERDADWSIFRFKAFLLAGL